MNLRKIISGNDLYLLMIFALISIVSSIPSRRAKPWVANSIGLGAFRLSRSKRQRMDENLARVFGNDLDRSQMRRIARGSFCEFWRDLFQIRLSKPEREALEQAEVIGKRSLIEALSQRKGVILLESSYLGRRNLAKQILRHIGISVHQVHNENHFSGLRVGVSTWVQRRLVKPFLEKSEEGCVAEIIYLKESDSLAYAKQLLDILQKNEVICVSGEGTRGYKKVKLRFLGDMGQHPTGLVNLARISGAPLLPIFCFELQNTRPRLVIEQPIEIETNIDRDAAAQNALVEYFRLLESYVMRYPGMYRHWDYAQQV